MNNKKRGSNCAGSALLIGMIVMAVLVVGSGVGLGAKTGLDTRKWNNLSQAVDSYRISYFSNQKENLGKRWEDTGVFDFPERKDILEQMEKLEGSAKEADTWFAEETARIQTASEQKEDYHLSDGYADYESYLESCMEALESRDYEKARELTEEADSQLEELIEENETYIEEKVRSYAALDLSTADVEDKTNLQTELQTAEQLAKEGKYNELGPVFEKMDEIAYRYMEPEHKLNISVQQVDASAFPNVRLYLRVEDALSGEVPVLDDILFFIRKQDANANFVKQQISRVSQLNENEALNVDMVADVSGSMAGQPIQEAKNVMSNFISSVQFSAGDLVELITFSSGVYLEEEFTNSASTLISKINGLNTGNDTSLYDALYTAVTRTAARSGAKCVMAFTDGMDNNSSCSSQDVIDLAKRYQVPIFIIGLGTSNYSEIRQIASETGGEYYEISNITSMADIYQEIYRKEKELYLVEFEDTTGTVTSSANITVGYHSETYGGECNYSYTPSVLMDVEGAALYQDGPEAVVEGYMKAFDDAMTNSDFSAISGFLKPESSIYQTQQQYVLKDISEMLDSYEIVSVDYDTNDSCVVTTRENYYVQKPGVPLELLTQQCRYRVIRENGAWKMTDFADSVQVLSRVKQ